MMNNRLPEALLKELTGLPGFDRAAFEETHASPAQVTSLRVNPAKGSDISANQQITLSAHSQVTWSKYGYYLDKRPSFTFDPLFHAGCYYVQEASSMFLEQALRQTVDLSAPLRVLDLCAAPGGKSTHIQSLIPAGSLLVSNEVIRSRVNILADNIIKWGSANVVVTNNDPAQFAKLENFFDVIVVDAPCSGSGLFRRDPEAIAEWSENNVQLCSQRQQRILADVWPALKKDGVLIYSTCSYSKEEDEDIVNWIKNELNAAYCPLLADTAWGITDTGSGYRFWPDKVKGEGFFIAAFRKQDGATMPVIKVKNKPASITAGEKEIVSNWIPMDDVFFVRHENTVYAWPGHLSNSFAYLLEKLRVIYSGIRTGELIRDKLIPDHALAMSGATVSSAGKIPLSYEQSIAYLQRKEIALPAAGKGWQLVTYNDFPLGWVNVLPNRVNNYYPKELRILKDR